MNRAFVIGAAIILASGALLLVITSDADKRQGRAGAGRAKSGSREGVSPTQAAKGLREMVRRRAGASDRSFEEVERMVSRLSGGELKRWREEVVDARADSVEGWIRSAVFAELARRDPKAAYDFIATLRSGDSQSGGARAAGRRMR